MKLRTLFAYDNSEIVYCQAMQISERKMLHLTNQNQVFQKATLYVLLYRKLISI